MLFWITWYLVVSCITIMYSYSVCTEEEHNAYMTSYFIIGLLWPLLVIGAIGYKIHTYCYLKKRKQNK
jgi:hypothetical protein